MEGKYHPGEKNEAYSQITIEFSLYWSYFHIYINFPDNVFTVWIIYNFKASCIFKWPSNFYINTLKDPESTALSYIFFGVIYS